MWSVLSVTFFISFAIYAVGFVFIVQAIERIYLSFIIKSASSSYRKYDTFSLLSYFFVVVIVGCLCHRIQLCHIYPEKAGFFRSFTIAQFMMCANKWAHSSPKSVYVWLCIIQSLKHMKCFWGIFFWVCMSQLKFVLSFIFDATYGFVCVQFTYVSSGEFKDRYHLSYYHNQMNH